jgi:hydrogenase nickel incorporation protein HypA/HybF
MHELPITQGLLDLALEHAARAGGGRITGLYLTIGELSRVVDASVQFYWDIISKDTPAEGAELHFRQIPLELECRDCEHSFSPATESFRCPNCDGVNVQVNAGSEFYLEAIDLESEPSDQAPIGSESTDVAATDPASPGAGKGKSDQSTSNEQGGLS